MCLGPEVEGVVNARCATVPGKSGSEGDGHSGLRGQLFARSLHLIPWTVGGLRRPQAGVHSSLSHFCSLIERT